MSVTLLEAVMHGIMCNLEVLEASPMSLPTLFERLKKHDEFSDEKLSEGLAKVTRVVARLTAAKEVFACS
jgi:hypothetical protein